MHGGLVAGLCGLVGYAAIGIGQHTIMNVTPSLPEGLYWRQTLGTFERGMVVEMSTPDAYVPYLDGLPPTVNRSSMLKQVSGLPGDTVCWDEDTVTVNGKIVAERTLQRERPHLDQMAGCRTLEAHELVVLGTHPRSLDSRYLGPIDRRRLLYRLRALWTWRAV